MFKYECMTCGENTFKVYAPSPKNELVRKETADLVDLPTECFPTIFVCTKCGKQTVNLVLDTSAYAV